MLCCCAVVANVVSVALSLSAVPGPCSCCCAAMLLCSLQSFCPIKATTRCLGEFRLQIAI